MFQKTNKNAGFSLVEFVIAITILLVLLGLVATLFARAMTTRERESRRTDALTSAQAAINVISREVANSGYGLRESNQSASNGLILADCTSTKIHLRNNVDNNNQTVTEPGENVTYYYEAATESIVRYDPNDNPQTSVVVNRISDVTFTYFDYTGSNSNPTSASTPTKDTGRIRITVKVELENVQGQPNGQEIIFTSDVTLRNSKYMLNQY